MQLRTERLLLRDFTLDDWPAVLAYQSDRRYLRFYQWDRRTPEDVRAFVQIFLDYQTAQPRHKYQLAVVLASSGELIGSCGIRKPSPDSRQADMGYEIAPAHWGHGYATEAALAVLRFGFAELDLHRIWATCLSENSASARVLEKLGMRREAHLRENEWVKGRWWDSYIYALLKREWEERYAASR